MKRRMPAHIVLPNGMWRFVKSGSRPKRPKRKGETMGRRRNYSRRFYRRARKSYRNGGGLMGIVTPVALGGIATYANRYAPQVVPMQNYGAAAFGGWFAKRNITGAALGLAGGFLVDRFVNGSTAGTSTGW